MGPAIPRTLPVDARPVRVAVIGMGAMGRGLFYQCGVTPGIECLAVADLDRARAAGFLDSVNVPWRDVDGPRQAAAAIGCGQVALSGEGEVLCRLDEVDVVIESTSSIEAGGRFALAALENGKHLVLMNAEVDLTFGPF